MKPKVTEKTVKLIEAENTIVFELDKRLGKEEIKKQIEEMLDVKIEKIRTHIKNNKKYAYIKLNKKNLAIDVATKLGLI